MEQLSTIRNRISSELDEMNRIIVESLHTRNKMMDDVVCSYLEKKGKQIRPIMVILSAKMFGDVTPEVLYAGASLEMLHNASLIHDDVVDETELRRGVPTLNARMGNRIAVLVGDYFVSCALACSLHTHSTSAVASLSSLGKELSLGEIDQICNAREHHFDEKSYYDMIRQKTASLFIHCVKMGAEMNGANEEQIGHMIRFGELLGLCFQIKDDIFDYFDSKEIGKPTGNDLREGKMTLPLLYALAHGPQEEAAELKEIICGDDLTEEEIARLIQFAKDNGGIEYAYERMREMQQEAAVELSHFSDSEAKQSFLDIFEFIISRNH
jgi:octaprenyl-diphosphate synthase